MKKNIDHIWQNHRIRLKTVGLCLNLIPLKARSNLRKRSMNQRRTSIICPHHIFSICVIFGIIKEKTNIKNKHTFCKNRQTEFNNPTTAHLNHNINIT